MNKYIPADKLIAEIERQSKSIENATGDFAEGRRGELDNLHRLITSLQQEQPMPNSTKLIELWHEDKEMLKEKDFRDDPWRLAYNAFMCGFGRGLAVKPEQPDNEDIDKVAQELYEHLYELKRRNNVPTNLYDKKEIIDLWKAGIEYARNHTKREYPKVELPEKYHTPDWLFKQPELDLEKAARHVYESWMGGTMDDVRRDMVELGKVLNARKEEGK